MEDAYKALEYQFTPLDNLINYICGNLEVNIQNMLILTLEARLKKYLRFIIAEMVEKPNNKENNKVIGFIIKKLTYSKNVLPYQKEPSQRLMQAIPILTKQIQALVGMDKLTETNVTANASQMVKFYWNIQKLFISKGQRSFALLSLSHFKCRKAEFGMNNLEDIKPDFSNLHTGSKSIHVSNIRTGGVQCSVVFSHKLEGFYERNKAEKEVKDRFKSKEQKDKEKRKREHRPNNFNKDYIVGIDPGIMNIITCFEGDENDCSLIDRQSRRKARKGRYWKVMNKQ
jgi:hypothetical protein